MPQANKLLGLPGYHALRPAIEFRRNAFGKRGNLSYAHGLPPLKKGATAPQRSKTIPIQLGRSARHSTEIEVVLWPGSERSA